MNKFLIYEINDEDCFKFISYLYDSQDMVKEYINEHFNGMTGLLEKYKHDLSSSNLSLGLINEESIITNIQLIGIGQVFKFKNVFLFDELKLKISERVKEWAQNNKKDNFLNFKFEDICELYESDKFESVLQENILSFNFFKEVLSNLFVKLTNGESIKVNIRSLGLRD